MRTGAKRKVFLFFLFIFCVVPFISPVFAEQGTHVYDAADILEDIRKGTDVRIDGGIIEGDLNFSKLDYEVLPNNTRVVHVQSQIHIVNSEIHGNVIAYALRPFTRVLFYEEINFTGNQILGYSLFIQTKFFSDVFFSKTQFFGAVTFYSVKFRGNARFTETQFFGVTNFGRTQFTGDAYFDGAQFSGDAGFYDAQFNGDAYFDGAQFSGEAKFHKTQFTGDAYFEAAEFQGSALFIETQFTGDAYFDGAQFSGDAGFSDTQFIGEAQFRSVEFRGRMFFRDTQFSEWVIFKKVDFFNVTYFDRARFSGQATFSEVIFFERLFFRHAHFSDLIGFISTKFLNSVYFSNDYFSKRASFIDSVFHNKSVFSGTEFKGFTIFSGSNISGAAHFDQTIFYSTADFRNTHIKSVLFSGLPAAIFQDIADFRGSHIERAFFIGTRFTHVDFSGVNFTMLDLRDTIYSSMKINWKEVAHKIRPRNDPEIFRSLEENFKNLNRLDYANGAFYQRKIAERLNKSPVMQDLEMIFLDWSCGYGVRPQNVVIVSAILILVFSLAYLPSDAMILDRSNLEAGKLAIRLKEFPLASSKQEQKGEKINESRSMFVRFRQALGFSFTVFTKISSGNIYGTSRVRPFQIIEWILGFVMISLLAYTLSQTVPLLRAILSGVLI